MIRKLSELEYKSWFDLTPEEKKKYAYLWGLDKATPEEIKQKENSCFCYLEDFYIVRTGKNKYSVLYME
jgi:hypothetical protein